MHTHLVGCMDVQLVVVRVSEDSIENACLGAQCQLGTPYLCTHLSKCVCTLNCMHPNSCACLSKMRCPQVSKDKCLVTRIAAEAAGGEGSASQGSGGEAGWKLILLSPAAQAHSLLLPATPANGSGNGGDGSGGDGGPAEGGELVEGGVKGDEGGPATSAASAEAATQVRGQGMGRSKA